MIAVPVKKRFPTLFHLVEAGLITEHEMDLIEKMEMNTSQVCHTVGIQKPRSLKQLSFVTNSDFRIPIFLHPWVLDISILLNQITFEV